MLVVGQPPPVRQGNQVVFACSLLHSDNWKIFDEVLIWKNKLKKNDVDKI